MFRSESKALSVDRRGSVSPAAIVVVLILLVVIGGGLYFLFGKSDDSMSTSTPADQLTEKQIGSLVEEVGKFILLPDEEPLIATVEDATELRSEQPFYKDVVDGDKLLIFPQAAKAVIYRESDKMLVNVGPIFVDNDASASAQLPEGTELSQ